MKRKKALILAIFGLVLTSCGNDKKSIIPPVTEQTTKSKNNKYENPTYPLVDGKKSPTYTADPYVIKDGLDYYMYCTQTEVIDESSAYRFKRGPIFKSIDLVNWTYVGNVFDNYEPNWGTSGAGVWAPTVIKIGNKWNYYYSLSTGGDKNPGIGVATSDNPYGPFTHYGKLFNSEEIGVTNSIDPHVFYDNEKLYMVFGSFGGLITLIELNDDGLSLKNGLEYQKENKHALAGYEIVDTNNYEASFILKAYGKYYLFLSTGTCCSGVKSTYRVVVGMSDSLFGPYKNKKGQDLFGPNRGETVISPILNSTMGVGHNAIIQDDANNYWMIYHGYDVNGEKPEYRSLYLDQLLFDQDNYYPYVLNYRASTELKDGPYINSLEE